MTLTWESKDTFFGFCGCGRRLLFGKCKKHPQGYMKPRENIGKWSGKSESPNAFGDYKE